MATHGGTTGLDQWGAKGAQGLAPLSPFWRMFGPRTAPISYVPISVNIPRYARYGKHVVVRPEGPLSSWLD